jgi:hypothetical protein
MTVRRHLAAPMLVVMLAALAGCGPNLDWVRPERSAEANRADRAACEEETYRRLRNEFAYERGLAGGDVPGFPSQNPIPDFPSRGSIAGSLSSDNLFARQDIDRARQRAEFRRQDLMRDCLGRTGFRLERVE